MHSNYLLSAYIVSHFGAIWINIQISSTLFVVDKIECPCTLHQLGMSNSEPKSVDMTFRRAPEKRFATADWVFMTGTGQSKPLVSRVSKFLDMPSL